MNVQVQVRQSHIDLERRSAPMDPKLCFPGARRPECEVARGILARAIAEALGVGATQVLVHRGPLVLRMDGDTQRDAYKNDSLYQLNVTYKRSEIRLPWLCEAFHSMLWHGSPGQALHLQTPWGRQWYRYEEVVRPFPFTLDVPDAWREPTPAPAWEAYKDAAEEVDIAVS